SVPRSKWTVKLSILEPFTQIWYRRSPNTGEADFAVAESRVFGHGVGEHEWMACVVDVPPVTGQPAPHTLQSLFVAAWILTSIGVTPIEEMTSTVATGSCTLAPGARLSVA